jgi:outer membrane protein assembly factor BamB
VLAWKSPSGGDTVVLLGGAVRTEGREESHETPLAFVSAAEGGPRWSRVLDGQVTTATTAGDYIVVRTLSGRIRVLARKDGALLRELPPAGILPNVAFCPGAGDTIVISSESRISCIELIEHAAGTDVHAAEWERKNRLRGLTPPSWTSLASSGGSIVAGRTDGSVAALDPLDGATRWETPTGSSIRRVAADTTSGRVFALTHDGRGVAIDAGKIVWTRDIDAGHESHAEPALIFTRSRVWIASPARSSVVCLDAADGRVLGALSWHGGQPWSARERTVIVAEDGSVSALQSR